MSWIWYCIEIAVNFVEFGLYVYLINSKLKNRMSSSLPSTITAIVGTAGISWIGLCHITWISEVVFEPLIIVIYALLTRKGKTWLKLFWTGIGWAMISAANSLGLALGLLISGATIQVILSQQSMVRVQIQIFCKMTQAIIFFFLTKWKTTTQLVSRPVIVCLIALPVTSIVTVALSIKYILIPELSLTNQLLLIGASFSVLIINLLVFVLYESLSKQAENNLQMQAKLQQNDMLSRHSQEVSGLYDEMRNWRHDYHNHLQVIHGYLQLNKIDKLEVYLEEIEEKITAFQMPMNSGNLLIDAIIGSKIILMRNNDIQVQTDIHVPPHLDMDDTDVCVLLGNLLDNAIEGCQRIDDQTTRFIEITIHIIKGHLHILVKNSTNGIIRKSGPIFLSNKAGKYHGIGIRRIEEITEKYGGYVNACHENNVFETNIMLPMDIVLKSLQQDIVDHTDHLVPS